MLIIPRLTEVWPFKCQGRPVSLWCWTLTCNLEKCYSLTSSFGMYNLETIMIFAFIEETLPLTTCSRSHALLNMNREETLEPTLWRHRWRHHREKNFFGIIWDDLFISEVKLKLCLIFQNFQSGRHSELATNIFTGRDTGSWIHQKDSHLHFRHFELLIEALAQIKIEIYQF